MVYGLGMNGGYASSQNGMQQMTQSYGNSKQTGSVMQGLKAKYGCEDCFTPGPYYANYPIAIHSDPHSGYNPPHNKRNGLWKLLFG